MRCMPVWLACGWVLLLGTLAMVAPERLGADQPEAANGDEKIGEVFGKVVYRRDLDEKAGIEDELRQVFLAPVWTRFQTAHKKEIEPTKAEIDAAVVVFEKKQKERFKESEPEIRRTLKELEEQLSQPKLPEAKRKELQKKKESWELTLELSQKPLGREFAVFMLSHWKGQKYLYDNYGGGRILWQQAGVEAFDATRKFLEAREKAGDFKFTDDTLRARFYAYWTTQNHGPFLTDDPDRIKQEFLNPPWAPKPPEKAPEKAPEKGPEKK